MTTPDDERDRAPAPFTVALMAGGRSTRMGTDKAFVQLAGRPLIAHVLERAHDLGDRAPYADTILIANRPEAFASLELPTFPDVIPGKGALGGIYTALHYSRHRDVLVVACDMPLVQPALLRYLLDLRAGPDGPFDVIIPRVDGYPQGLLAIYARTCLEPIRADLEADRLKVIGFHDRVRVRYVDETEYTPLDPRGLSFFNVNTPEDLEQARQLIADA